MRRLITAAVVVVAGFTAAGCSTTASSSSSSGPACPAQPVNVVVSVSQWGDIVDQLAGTCGVITTVISSSATDPHDFEPSTGDIAAFSSAQLVVVNGDGYDDWATKAVESASSNPTVVNAAEVVGAPLGSNPHLWYNPDYVMQTATAVTKSLKSLAPNADSYFDEAQVQWQESMKPYFAEIESIKAKATGDTYAATEGVFDYMAAACGLVDKTPSGYQNAANNETDPSPGDLAAFEELLKATGVDVLVFNIQTEGAVPAQLRSAAEAAQVPVVNVTETPPEGDSSFQTWQIGQLQQLAKALGVS